MANPVFEIYNADGTLQLDLASGITKVIGVANQAGAFSGSIQVPEFQNNRGWFAILNSQGRWYLSAHTVEISGTTLSWSTYLVGQPEPPLIQYGIY
ncbi:hypothetical protein uan_069 [Pseudomonas phage UAntarctica]|nr:hypothetical protein uan_069 [Pseudomonas phage UAntarctica]